MFRLVFIVCLVLGLLALIAVAKPEHLAAGAVGLGCFLAALMLVAMVVWLRKRGSGVTGTGAVERTVLDPERLPEGVRHPALSGLDHRRGH